LLSVYPVLVSKSYQMGLDSNLVQKIINVTVFSRVATAPISWGICEVPGWGYQMTPDRVLSEMAASGFTHTELGSAGWLPKEPEELNELLGRHNLKLLGAFVPLVMHDAGQAEFTIQEAHDAAGLLKAAGASHFIAAPVMTYDWGPRRELSDEEWNHLVMMFAKVDQICADHDLTQVVHEHFGCAIETEADVERLLATSNVKFVLDTGHLALGGFDPLRFSTEFPERVGLVHLKDTNLSFVEPLNDGEITLMEAVQQGLFTALGSGDLLINQIIDNLEAAEYGGIYVVEQDCALVSEPATGEGPIRDVLQSVSYIQNEANLVLSGPSINGEKT
jgi:inosose dehydratase